MDKVTSGFGEYDLKEVIKEYTEFGHGEELEQVLPKTVGGTKVHLLFGIKNTRLQPTLLNVLPSGVGVYLSPFKDVWGSRIMFAGPHKVFSKINKEKETLIIPCILLKLTKFKSSVTLIWRLERKGSILR